MTKFACSRDAATNVCVFQLFSSITGRSAQARSSSWTTVRPMGPRTIWLAQSDVHLFRTTNRYREARSGLAWLNALLAEFGVGFWCVTVDIDELLVFPGSEQASLAHPDRPSRSARSRRPGVHAPRHVSPEPRWKAAPIRQAMTCIAAAPYFDAGPYQRVTSDECPGFLIMGGVRERVFHPDFRTRGLGREDVSRPVQPRAASHADSQGDMPWIRRRRPPSPPALSKVPLVRWDAGSRYLKSVHRHFREDGRAGNWALRCTSSSCTTFTPRPFTRQNAANTPEARWSIGAMPETLDQNPQMTFMYEGSVRFEGTRQLVRPGPDAGQRGLGRSARTGQRVIGTTP